MQFSSKTGNRPSQRHLGVILATVFEKWPGHRCDHGKAIPPETALGRLSARPAGPLDLTAGPFRPPYLTLLTTRRGR